ncbi:hypothetical protein ACFS5J_04715 [Flavobacterium chuncheonense]|uniref:Uncharacterized protein n=1 Tax=Flavobacterium chuncheonense TaxID=2026653 RepID=A0ABW5YKP3_9FLAO
MQFYYEKLEPNFILEFLKDKRFAAVLDYMITFTFYEEFVVTPYPYHIELKNDDKHIILLLYVGFDFKQYMELDSVHIVSLNPIVWEMVEFENLNIKYVSPYALFNMISELIPETRAEEIRFLLTNRF